MSALRLARNKLEKGDTVPYKISPIIDGNLLVGLTIVEAQNKYPGMIIRPCVIDGIPQIVHLNYNTHRHNVHIKNGIINELSDMC